MTSGRVAYKSVVTGAPAASRRPLGLTARRLAVALGLGSLAEHQRCHSYANGCMCGRCRDRARKFEHLTAKGFSPRVAAALAREDATYAGALDHVDGKR